MALSREQVAAAETEIVVPLVVNAPGVEQAIAPPRNAESRRLIERERRARGRTAAAEIVVAHVPVSAGRRVFDAEQLIGIEVEEHLRAENLVVAEWMLSR